MCIIRQIYQFNKFSYRQTLAALSSCPDDPDIYLYKENVPHKKILFQRVKFHTLPFVVSEWVVKELDILTLKNYDSN
jgi:hypothetical protein